MHIAIVIAFLFLQYAYPIDSAHGQMCNSHHCNESCAILNIPATSIDTINPTVTFNNIVYTSTIHQESLGNNCTNPHIIGYPSTSDTSLLNNLRAGQFIGAFSCPIAMCLCTTKLNGIIDCYRGDASAQILLLPINRRHRSMMLGVVIQSSITSHGDTMTSPQINVNGTYPSLLPLKRKIYLKINHIACVNSTTASNRDICPIAAV